MQRGNRAQLRSEGTLLVLVHLDVGGRDDWCARVC